MSRDVLNILQLGARYSMHHNENATVEELKAALTRLKRNRMIWVWHDHSSLASHGILAVMVELSMVQLCLRPRVKWTSRCRNSWKKMKFTLLRMDHPHWRTKLLCKAKGLKPYLLSLRGTRHSQLNFVSSFPHTNVVYTNYCSCHLPVTSTVNVLIICNYV